MKIKQLIKNLFGKTNKDRETMDYCFAHGFTAGKNFNYNSGFPIDTGWPWLISVGDNVTLASNVKLLAHDASTNRIPGCHTKVGIVQLGNNVFIGHGSIVLPNVRIGDNVIVGAGSVVTRDIPSNSVYAGNPARFVCFFEDFSDRNLERQKSHPKFDKHKWYEWKDASPEEWAEMKEKLKDTFGYL